MALNAPGSAVSGTPRVTKPFVLGSPHEAAKGPLELLEKLFGLSNRMCCCATDNTMPAAMDMVTPQPTDFFFKEFSLAGPCPDQIEEAEKVDERLTLSMAGGRSGRTNALRQQLLLAVREDDAPGVLQHLADGADIRVIGEALRLAAHRGSAQVVRELVAVGLSVNETCPQTHYTPIHLASAGGHHVVCEVLLDAMADVHKPIGRGAAATTALSIARRSGHAEVEEVITRHITSLVMSEQGEGDFSHNNRRAHVLPRVSPFLSETVLQALPAPKAKKKEEEIAADDGIERDVSPERVCERL